MADPPSATYTDDATRVGPGGESPPRTPRWVIILGIIALILLLALAAQFVLGLQHGPGLHGAS